MNSNTTATRFISLIERNLGESPSKVLQLPLEVYYSSSTGTASATVGSPESTLFVDNTSGKILRSLCRHLLKGYSITDKVSEISFSNVVVLNQESIRKHADVTKVHYLHLRN